MFRYYTEFFNYIEPITAIEFKAWTNKGAVKKAYKMANEYKGDKVYFVRVVRFKRWGKDYEVE